MVIRDGIGEKPQFPVSLQSQQEARHPLSCTNFWALLQYYVIIPSSIQIKGKIRWNNFQSKILNNFSLNMITSNNCNNQSAKRVFFGKQEKQSWREQRKAQLNILNMHSFCTLNCFSIKQSYQCQSWGNKLKIHYVVWKATSIIIQHFPSISMEGEKLKNKTETGNSYSTNILESPKNICFTFVYIQRLKPSKRWGVAHFPFIQIRIQDESLLLINIAIQIPDIPSNVGWKLQPS